MALFAFHLGARGMSIAFAHPRGGRGDRQGFLAFLELGDVDAGVAGFLLEGEMLLGRGNDEFGVVDQEFLEGALAFLLGDGEHDVKEGAPVLDEGAAGFKGSFSPLRMPSIVSLSKRRR